MDKSQGILDSYHFRFDPEPNITIVVEARNVADFEAGLASSPAHVARMARHAPASASNPSPSPVLHTLPRLLERYPHLAILIFSARADPYQIHSTLEAGARGHSGQDDVQIYPVLPQVLATVYQGGIYYSPTAQSALRQIDAQATPAGNFRDFTATSIRVGASERDGSRTYKAIGAPFVLHGVRVWPEVLPVLGIADGEALKFGDNPLRRPLLVHAALTDDGKVHKVISLATAPVVIPGSTVVPGSSTGSTGTAAAAAEVPF